jgi:hypothetical protein
LPSTTRSKSTAYDHLHEGTKVLAARAPKLESALLAAKAAGHRHVGIDGTPIEIDRPELGQPRRRRLPGRSLPR